MKRAAGACCFSLTTPENFRHIPGPRFRAAVASIFGPWLARIGPPFDRYQEKAKLGYRETLTSPPKFWRL